MEYYYVFVWAEGDQEWSPIKEFIGSMGQRIAVINSQERLSYEEAFSRCQVLSARHPNFKFKVDRFFY